jgi:hypothetical protein
MKRKTMLNTLTLMYELTGDIKQVLKEIEDKEESYFASPKTTGRLRRHSMDLTRKLAELRAGK